MRDTWEGESMEVDARCSKGSHMIFSGDFAYFNIYTDCLLCEEHYDERRRDEWMKAGRPLEDYVSVAT